MFPLIPIKVHRLFTVYVYFLLTLTFVTYSKQQDTTSQIKNTHTVLWRISKNGLPYSSYVFGTIHLQDKRVFRLADSVLPAIQKCKLFANEVRLDTLMSEIIVSMYDTTKGKRLEDVISKQELDSIAPKLAEKLSIPLQVVPKIRSGLLYYILEGGFLDREEKTTMLDAYLLGHARTMGKQLYALEPFESQLTILDDVAVSTIRSVVKQTLMQKLKVQIQKEKMIKLYDLGNIDSLLSIIRTSMSAGMIDTMLTARNKVMAASIDSLTKVAPLFAAIGTGHLPGEFGVLQLLRNIGYTVEPVLPTYTGVAAKYDSIDITASSIWYPYTSEKNGFEVKLPSKLAEAPLYKQMYGSLELEMPMTADIISGNSFMVMGLRLPKVMNRIEIVRYSDVVAKRLLQPRSTDSDDEYSTDTVPRAEVLHNGTLGYEYEGIGIQGKYYRIRSFVRNTGAYFLVIAGTKASTHSSIADTFFTSLRFLSSKRLTWQQFTDTNSAATISMPGKPLFNEEAEQVYYCSDASTGTTFRYIWSSLPGLITAHTIKDYVSGLLLKTIYSYNKDSLNKYVQFDTLPNGSFRARYRSYPAGTESIELGELIIRNKHVYELLYNTTDFSNIISDSIQFFSSLKFLPFKRSNSWNKYTCEQFPISAQFPNKPFVDTTKYNEYKSVFPLQVAWFLNEPSTGNNYSIYASEYSPYYSVKYSSDSLYIKLLEPNLSRNDTVVSQVRTSIGTQYKAEYLIAKKQLPYTKKLHLYLVGNTLYSASLLVHNDSLNSEDVLKFFNSIKIQDTTSSYDFTANRFNIWLSDITSTDTTKINRAHQSLKWLSFDSTQSKYLHNALTHNSYSDDTIRNNNYYYNTIRYTLLQKLPTVLDSTPISFLANLYHQYKNYPQLQVTILSNLVDKQTDSSISIALTLLLQKPPKPDSADNLHYYSLFRSLQDSIQLIKPHIQTLIALANNKALKQHVYSLWSDALDNNVITMQEFLLLKKSLVSDLSAQWKIYNRSLQKPIVHYYDDEDTTKGSYNEYDYESSSILAEICRCITKMEYDKSIEKQVRTMSVALSNKNLYLLFNSTLPLLRWNKPVPDSSILILCNNVTTVGNVIRELDSTNKRHLLPENLRTQYQAVCAYLKELMYDYEDEDEEYSIDSVELITTKYIETDSVSGMVYLMCYRMKGDTTDNQNWNTALMGYFPKDNTILRPTKEFFKLYGKKRNQLTPDEHIAEFLKKEEKKSFDIEYNSYDYYDD